MELSCSLSLPTNLSIHFGRDGQFIAMPTICRYCPAGKTDGWAPGYMLLVNFDNLNCHMFVLQQFHTYDSVEGMWWPQLFFVVPHLFLWMFDLSIVLAWTGVCSFAYWVLYHSQALCLHCVTHSLLSKRQNLAPLLLVHCLQSLTERQSASNGCLQSKPNRRKDGFSCVVCFYISHSMP